MISFFSKMISLGRNNKLSTHHDTTAAPALYIVGQWYS